MNTILKLIAIAMNAGLLIVAVTNILTAPIWMVLMILISSTVICVMTADLAKSLKKVKAFTMFELIAVMAICAILLTMVVSVTATNPHAKTIKKIGSTIQSYHGQSFKLDPSEHYEIVINSKLTIKDTAGAILKEIDLDYPVVFSDGSTSKTFYYNSVGQVKDSYSKIVFKVGEYEASINSFSGKLVYY